MSLTCHLKGVSNSYGGRVVLEPADYEFPPGKITCIIGPNGSGKSTLLGIASYLVKPDAGTVEYNDGGSPIPPGLSLRRRLTSVTQSPLLFSTTLFKNITYGLKFRNLTNEEIRARASTALQLGGLSHLAYARAKTLSGGRGTAGGHGPGIRSPSGGAFFRRAFLEPGPGRRPADGAAGGARTEKQWRGRGVSDA